MAYRYAFLDPFADNDYNAGAWGSSHVEHSPRESLSHSGVMSYQIASNVSHILVANRSFAISLADTEVDSANADGTEDLEGPSSESLNPQNISPPYATTLDYAGQGVVATSSSATNGLLITISTPDKLKTLMFTITPTSCEIVYGSPILVGGAPTVSPFPKEWVQVYHGDQSCWLREGEKTTYWISLDHINGSLKYGKYYTSANLKLIEVTFKKREGANPVWISEDFMWLKDLKDVTVTELGKTETQLDVKCRPLPLVHDLPPYVVSSEKISVSDLEANVRTVVGNLPAECQKLYANVAGGNIVLNTPDFPDFETAIQHSVNNEGFVGHNLLVKKATEHKMDFVGTYLRITIGFAEGDSPGIPYVLEIWPAGHHSPIHDHGDSFAVIKVLCGAIHCYYYDELRSPAKGGPREVSHAELRTNDITWISNNNYQVHQLRNQSEDKAVCCTLQCYQYGKDDKVHDENFHFLAEDPAHYKEDFHPTSDMAYGEFKRQVQAEWTKWKREQGL